MTRRTRRSLSAAATALAIAGVSAGVVLSDPVTASPAPAPAADAKGAEWGYLGKLGPSHWGDLGYPTCSKGDKQSPIDINTSRGLGLANPRFDYGRVKLTLAETGHGVNVAPAKGSRANIASVNGKKYTFLQFHHHGPSEHQIDGLHYPAEVHFVNQAKDGSLAVFGVMFRGGGPTNKAWKPVLDVITKATADPGATSTTADLNALLPKDRRSFRYEGSLTTPPCSEGVAWTVFTKPVVLSSAQLNNLLEAYQGNARPVQPLNGRSVLFDRTAKR